jgi:hypothetical protein
LTGQFKSVLDVIKSKVRNDEYNEKLTESLNTLKASELFEIDRELSDFAKEESETFFT